MNDEKDFDDEMDLDKKFQEMFSELTDKMDKLHPGFRASYNEGLRTAGVFKDSTDEVIANKDIWKDALTSSDEFMKTATDMLAYIGTVHNAAKLDQTVVDTRYLVARVSDFIKWAFIRGVLYSELRDAPEAFSKFIEDELSFD
jgi:hypothetical protein